MRRVLVIDTFSRHLLEPLFGLDDVHITYLPHSEADQVHRAATEAEVLVLRNKAVVNTDLLTKAPKLKLVVRGGSGLEHIDDQALAKRNIALVNTPGENADAVGEFALAAILSLFRNLNVADRQLRRGAWVREENRGIELAGRCVGLLGYGYTGQAVARRLKLMGAKVLAYDKYRKNYSDDWATEASLPDIQAQAEVLSFHVPLTDETIGYYNPAFMQAMANPHWVLNLSRGPVVDWTALKQGLRGGKVLGVALDVFPREPYSAFSEQDLRDLRAMKRHPNVILSPHIAGLSQESARRVDTKVFEAVNAFLQG